jgi:MSHA biogenesis protein MshL
MRPSYRNLAISLWVAVGTAGCSFLDLRPDRSDSKEIAAAMEQHKLPSVPRPKRFQTPPPSVSDALLPDLGAARQSAHSASRDRRFDISVVQVDAREFFMGLVADSAYNVIVHPDVKGAITIDLKNVTLPEVLDAVREVYGYDYKRADAGYIIYPAELTSRVYHVDYLNFVRNGRSETRVSSGPSSQSFPNQGGGGTGFGGQNYGGGGFGGGTGGTGSSYGSSGYSGGGASESEESVDCRSFRGDAGPGGEERNRSQSSAGTSRGVPNIPGSVIATSSTSHFWRELKQALGVLVCTVPDANFVVNQQAGVVIVRAYARQMREVEQFLDAIRREIQRQVVLEAKILEVVLNDGYQAGVDWASVIRVGENSMLTSLTGPIGGLQALSSSTAAIGQAFTISANMGDFSAFIELLETQGNVNTLSSPRISTLNNQKAVIKVGTDELHVSNVNPGSFANNVSGGGFSPSPVLSPFFSGISLDVTPQIDDYGKVTLHIHPSVTDVTDKVTRLNFGNGDQEIPLANSQVRESDSVVHAQNGQIVVIGGLMQNREQNQREGVAWLSRIPVLGSLFRRGTGTFQKSELVILLKPTIIDEPADWNPVREEMRARADRLGRESRKEVLP